LFFKSPPALVLASTSIYRRQLLERLKMPFECIAPHVDETRHAGESASALVVRLARAKADAVAAQRPDACVVGSDQVAVLLDSSGQEVILGKPATRERSIQQLEMCSGRAMSFLTAVALVRRRDAALREFVDTTRVAFRVLERADIERYVEQESALDCAGGFKCEGLGITLCDSIDSSDPTALIGLPLIRLSAALRALGF
jgi:septum formation protein